MNISENRKKQRGSAEAYQYVAALKVDGTISARELLEASKILVAVTKISTSLISTMC
jgi:hypothetical protein